MKSALQRAAEGQDEGDERNAHDNDDPVCDRAGRPDTGGHPDAGCRGQSLNSFAAAMADDHAGTDEPYSGQDPWITRLMPALSRRLTASTINAAPSPTRPSVRTPVDLP